MNKDTDKNIVEEPIISGRSSPLTYMDKGLLTVEKVLNYVAVSLVMFLMVFATVAVFTRYAINRPLAGYVDISEVVMVIVVFFGLSYTQWAGGHISVDIFITKWIKGRLHHITEFFTTLLSLTFYSFIAVYGLKAALQARAISDLTLTIYWLTWPFKLCMAIGSFVLCLRFIIQMFRHLARATAGIEFKGKS